MQLADVGLFELTIPACLEIGVTTTFIETVSKSGCGQSRIKEEKSRREQVVWNELFLGKGSWKKKRFVASKYSQT